MMQENQTEEMQDTMPELALSGNNAYRIEGDRVIISATKIINNRPADNLSGTLAVELWALSHPYDGGDFNGCTLAGTQIGELSGQHFLTNCHYDLLFQKPTPGTWYLSLMLREWIGTVFITRDYVNFAEAYIVDAEPDTESSPAANSMDTNAASKASPTPADEPTAAPTSHDKPEQTASPPSGDLFPALLEKLKAMLRL